LPGKKSQKVFMKIHKVQKEVLVALCDRAVIGKTFREGELRMKVFERFYRGTLLEVDDCDPYLMEATIGNFVGKDSVGKAVELGLVDRENVLTVEGVPHAQMIKVYL
jgi:hypothetical protein